MSQQRSLEQERAKMAWERVKHVSEHGKGYAKEYGQLAKSALADIQANGLGQTLAFWRAKGMKDGKPKDHGENAHWRLYEHVSDWVMKRMNHTPSDGLMGWVIAVGTTTDDYRRATAEGMAFLGWLKRFAEAELGGD